MKSLSNLFEKFSGTNWVHRLSQLFRLEIDEGISITDHLTVFNDVVNSLKAVDYKLDESLLREGLLLSLLESWSTKVEVISALDGLTLDNVKH